MHGDEDSCQRSSKNNNECPNTGFGAPQKQIVFRRRGHACDRGLDPLSIIKDFDMDKGKGRGSKILLVQRLSFEWS